MTWSNSSVSPTTWWEIKEREDGHRQCNGECQAILHGDNSVDNDCEARNWSNVQVNDYSWRLVHKWEERMNRMTTEQNCGTMLLPFTLLRVFCGESLALLLWYLYVPSHYKVDLRFWTECRQVPQMRMPMHNCQCLE
jgi:hypothetical protein